MSKLVFAALTLLLSPAALAQVPEPPETLSELNRGLKGPVTFRLLGENVGDGDVAVEVGYGDLDGLVDVLATVQTSMRARVMGGVAYEGEPFEGLASGSAKVRFTVSDEGWATGIEVVEATSPVVERFARFQALATRFEPGATGRSGTATVTLESGGL